ncbi:MAG: ABC transporter ATP-binding protein [Firmicutes bacterium]|nr:ABC transporter ATP-binding protein [Bacillota bacterium]
MKKILWLLYKLDPMMYVLTAVCSLVEALEGFGMILLSSVLLNQLMEGRAIKELLGLMAVLVAAYGILNFAKQALQQWRLARVEDLIIRHRRMVTEKVFSVPFENMERSEFIELLSTIRLNDQNYSLVTLTMENLYTFLKNVFSVLVAIYSFISLFGVIQRLGGSAFLVSMLILGIFVLIVGSTGYIVWRKKQNAITMQKLNDELMRLNQAGFAMGQVVEGYTYGKHIRIGQMQERILQDEKKEVANIQEFLKHYFNLDLGISVAGDVSSMLISGMIYFTVGVVALAGGLGVGSIIWYAGVVQRLLEGIRSLVFEVGSLQSHCIRQQPIFELLDIASSSDGDAAQVPDLPEHVIEFEDVSFAYPDTNRMILEHVNLRLSGQERIALVGRNGCGKSTLIKLLCRLYDPTEGRILLDGVDIRTFPRQEYMKMLSVVFQDFHIFADSLAGNIAMADTVDREYAASIVGRVGLGLTDLDQPLLRHLDEKGIEVSGGEGQKIAIARALYKDAPLVILDEPTAALDPLAESEIYEKFNLLVEGKLALFISHRLSSCRFCDRILVMQDGRIAQDGSHEELASSEGLYQQMWNAQKQYYV